MTDNNDEKTLSASGKKTLTLKPSGVNQGTVRQDMGRGRTKAVVVETRKRRPLRPEDDKQVITPVTAPAPAAAARVEAAPQPAARPAQPQIQTRVNQPSGIAPRAQPAAPTYQARPQQDRPSRPVVLNHLSPDEMDARRRACRCAGP